MDQREQRADIFVSVYLFPLGWVSMSHQTHGGQKTTPENQSAPSILWDPGGETQGTSDLQVSGFSCESSVWPRRGTESTPGSRGL